MEVQRAARGKGGRKSIPCKGVGSGRLASNLQPGPGDPQPMDRIPFPPTVRGSCLSPSPGPQIPGNRPWGWTCPHQGRTQPGAEHGSAVGASCTVSSGAGTVGIVQADDTDPRLRPEPLPSVHPESQHPTGALWARELQRAGIPREGAPGARAAPLLTSTPPSALDLADLTVCSPGGR